MGCVVYILDDYMLVVSILIIHSLQMAGFRLNLIIFLAVSWCSLSVGTMRMCNLHNTDYDDRATPPMKQGHDLHYETSMNSCRVVKEPIPSYSYVIFVANYRFKNSNLC